MNEHVRPPLPSPSALVARPESTQFADGYARRVWTADELRRMVEAGIMPEGEPFELIGGELVAKMQKGIAHENLKRALNKYWGKRIPDHLEFVPESPLRLGPHDEPEPDFFVFPAGTPMEDVRGPTVLLVVEIADTSLRIDGSLKLRRYAGQGVREYWIINARTRETTVMREPSETGYGKRFEVPESEQLIPLYAPELALRIADLR